MRQLHQARLQDSVTGGAEINQKFTGILRPKSEIQVVFPTENRRSPKKKKIFTKISRDFTAEIGISSGFSGRKQVISKKKKKVFIPKTSQNPV